MPEQKKLPSERNCPANCRRDFIDECNHNSTCDEKQAISAKTFCKQSRVTENAAAAEIALNAETVERISSLAAPGMANGQTLV